MLAYVRPMLAYVGLGWAYVGPMLAYVGPMLACAGPMLSPNIFRYNFLRFFLPTQQKPWKNLRFLTSPR